MSDDACVIIGRMDQIGNSRYVVIGERPDGKRWAIASGDSRIMAEQACEAGRCIDGTYWRGVRVHDRNTEGVFGPDGGWGELT